MVTVDSSDFSLSVVVVEALVEVGIIVEEAVEVVLVDVVREVVGIRMPGKRSVKHNDKLSLFFDNLSIHVCNNGLTLSSFKYINTASVIIIVL
jgi:hypothetical protein